MFSGFLEKIESLNLPSYISGEGTGSAHHFEAYLEPVKGSRIDQDSIRNEIVSYMEEELGPGASLDAGEESIEIITPELEFEIEIDHTAVEESLDMYEAEKGWLFSDTNYLNDQVEISVSSSDYEPMDSLARHLQDLDSIKPKFEDYI